MKLKMFAFDFEKCTLEFSVPKEIMHTRSFGNVPGGVEVDMVAITGDATLGTMEGVQKQSGETPVQQQQGRKFCPIWSAMKMGKMCGAGHPTDCAEGPCSYEYYSAGKTSPVA